MCASNRCIARSGVGALVALLFLAAATRPALAGQVEFIAPQLSVASSVETTVGAVTNADDNHASSDTAGSFAAEAKSDASAALGGFTLAGHATARQDSLLAPARIRFKGFLETHADTVGSPADGAEALHFNAAAQAMMSLRFILPDAQRVLIDGQTDGGGDVDPHHNFSGKLQLTRHEDGEVFDLRSFGPRELDAGTYDLDFRFGLSPPSSLSPEPTSFDFTVNVQFAPIAIPLPTAFWSGLALLAAVAVRPAVRWLRRQPPRRSLV
jgi:hypothetical protein